ncbi:MAG TPA: archaetidylserine decarboxylase [Polyangia bacterium]|jgi:phosphatidylserine decarboxylase|nr:archaetidylserine decarboxylase [Polyangia bacterium]
MTMRNVLHRVFLQEDLNFLLTNRIPRALVTRFFGWFSKLENPLVRDVSIGVWRLFADVDLSEAEETEFRSLQHCFVRKLKHGARPIDADPAVLTSPCDAIVGACGQVQGDQLIQAKGLTYTLSDLLRDPELAHLYRDGSYVTLRLTSSMYHRFHAPHECRVEQVTYVSGDTFNTNPITVGRVDRLFCKNERAIVRTRLDGNGALLTLVPVASILVASIRFHFLDVLFHLKYPGPRVISCDAPFKKGEEMGWFELGSTIIVFAPRGFELQPGIDTGATIRMGVPLMRLP